MKKLLLPLMALSLVGCNDSRQNETVSWTTVKPNEVIAVIYGNESTSFFPEKYKEVSYTFFANSGYMRVDVRTMQKETTNYNYYVYIGTNVTLLIYSY